MSAVPPSPGYFSDNPYQTPNMPPGYDPNTPRRGMVSQVRIMAVLNMVQGGLEFLMSVMYLVMGGFFAFVMREEMARQAERRGDPGGEAAANFVTILMFALGGIMLVVAVVRILASLRNYFFQSRVLGIVSLCLGLATVFTGYCALTSIGIAIYGLIVLFNKEVAEGFEMRSNGTPADDVVATFSARPW
jgi:hypothetical protein